MCYPFALNHFFYQVWSQPLAEVNQVRITVPTTMFPPFLSLPYLFLHHIFYLHISLPYLFTYGSLPCSATPSLTTIPCPPPHPLRCPGATSPPLPRWQRGVQRLAAVWRAGPRLVTAPWGSSSSEQLLLAYFFLFFTRSAEVDHGVILPWKSISRGQIIYPHPLM